MFNRGRQPFCRGHHLEGTLVLKDMCQTLGTFGDKNVERKRRTYDVTLTSFTGACPISASKPRQIDVIRTAFTFYIRVTKGLYQDATHHAILQLRVNSVIIAKQAQNK